MQLPILPNASETHRKLRLVAVTAVIFAVFVVYVNACRMTTFHDDLYNIRVINDQTVLSVFDPRPFGHRDYRPLLASMWILARDMFGWFVPAILHAYNVIYHTIATALVAALALRVGQWVGMRQCALTVFAVVAALVFGLFPLAYQPVIWAGGVSYPLALLLGLSAIHLYLYAVNGARRRPSVRWYAGVFALLLLACFSHEQAFLMGVLLVLVEAIRAWSLRRKFNSAAVALCAAILVYPVIYRLVITSVWNNPDTTALAKDASGLLNKIAYHTQAFTGWLLIVLRDALLPITPTWLALLPLAIVVVSAGLLILHRAGYLKIGWLGIGWWVIAMAPSTLVLSEGYLSISMRNMYMPFVGVSLFWAAVLVALGRALLQPLRHTGSPGRRWLRWSMRLALTALVALVAGLLAWSVGYIGARMAETERYTDAIRSIDRDLDQAAPGTRVLLVNAPLWSTPLQPAFVSGAESIMFWIEQDAPPSALIASVRGRQVETAHTRHDAFLTHNNQWTHGIAGQAADEAGVRAQALGSDWIYRFDYDPPGLRARRIGAITHDAQPHAAPLARLSSGLMQTAIQHANAWQCRDRAWLDIEWMGVDGIVEPAGVFVHGLDPAGQQVLVADRDLLDGVLPLNDVPPNTIVRELREITVPPAQDETTPVVAELRIGVYTRSDLKRFTALRSDGAAWPGDEVIVPVENRCR